MEKVTRIKRVSGSMCKERMIVKSVSDAHVFLNKQYDNNWSVYTGVFPSGTYAFAGGKWHNVKHLSPELLAHI